MEAYTSFAEVYDTFMDNVPYEEWADYLEDRLKEYGVKDGLVLELGCGTGSMTEELDDLGETTRLLMQLFHEGKQQNHVDHKFHNTIYRLAHNDALYQLITSLETTMVSFWEYPLDLEDPFLKSIPLHEKLYFAIREKNVKKAQSINEKLLDEVEYEISQKY